MAHLLCCIRARNHMKDDQDEKKQQNMASTSDSSSLGSGHVIDLVNMETTGFQKRLWDRVLEEESRKLRAQTPANLRGAMLLPVPTAASRGVAQQQQLALAEECLQRLTTQYNQRGWSRRVSTIRDIFESVQPFTVAVNTVVQASDAAAISWGCLTLVFTAVLRFASFWDDLQSLLQDLATTLPRLHAYTDVYHTPRLHSTLRIVYCRFNGICLKTQAFLNEACFAAVMRLQWTAFAQTFKRESEELRKATIEFEKEVTLASHQEQKTRHAEILANLTTIQHTMSAPDGTSGSAVVVENSFVSNIHLHRNEKFTGRDDVLAQIHAYLHLAEEDASHATPPSIDTGAASGKKPRSFCSCLVHAIGGMGKTEVALEYTYRFRALYTHIFWVRAGSPELLARSYEEIFDKVGLSSESGDGSKTQQMSQAQKVQGTLDWLRTTNGQWLLVFDNAEDPADIRPFWPASPTGSIIITSQNPELSQLTKYQVPLRPLQSAEGARLVQSYLFRGGSEEDAASKLAAALGGLPLAIVHFVGYIARSQCPIDEIAESLKERLQSSQIWDMVDASVSSSTRAYEHSLATVWDLALHRLSPDARFLIEKIAFLDPDHLPVDLFARRPSETSADSKIAVDVDALAWQYWEPTRFNDAIGMLCQRNLVERYMSPDGDCLKTHRMLQRSILQRLDRTPDKRQAAFDQVVSILRRSVPTINIIGRSDNSQFPVYAKYLPQLLVLHESSNLASTDPGASRVEAGLGFIELVADFGFYCRTQDETTALPVLRSAEAACAEMDKDREWSSSKDEAKRRRFLKLRADILSLISVIVKPRGKAGQAEAFAYLDRIIEIRRAELEGIPREVWTEEQTTNHHRALVDRALTLCYADRVEEAARPMEEAESFYASVGNETRRQHVRMQYTWILATRQDAARAKAYGQEAVDYMTRELGAENPLTQQARSRFGAILFTIGDLEGSKREHEISFKWRFLRYGRYHDETLGSLFCLAVSKQHLGDLAGAEEDLRTVLQQNRTSEEWREADVYRVKYRLFLVLELQRRQTEANQVWAEIQEYLSRRMGETGEALLLRNRREIAEVLDGDIVTLDHGRTAGIWSNGTYW